MGLQKVYLRMISYLYDDSKFVLSELMAPFIKHEIKDELVAASKKKKKPSVVAPGIHGHAPFTMKLDLKNSKWWKAGFDNTYL
jgi:hypothetical protein